MDTLNSPEGQRVQQRAFEARDVLSSFEKWVLPFEYQEPIFRDIDKDREGRMNDRSLWTRPGDLEGSLLQHAAHFDETLQVLLTLQPAERRIRLFRDTLKLRLDEVFGIFECLKGDTRRTIQERPSHVVKLCLIGPGDRRGPPQTVEEVKVNLMWISHALDYQFCGYRDHIDLPYLKRTIAPIVIQSIIDLCRTEDVEGGGRQPVSDNLLDLMFDGDGPKNLFVINVLRKFTGMSIEDEQVQINIQDALNRLKGIERFQNVLKPYINVLTGLLQ